ncbi:MAG: DUF2490 domain-containing protein [Flavobacterium sp.]|nr:DUF2490 domain-containing protein [Flavobacterium sp.]
MKTISLILLALIFCNFSFSQKSDIENWFIYVGNQKINDNWNWHHEVQYRNFDFIGDTNQLLLSPGIGHNLTEDNYNLLLGYRFIQM